MFKPPVRSFAAAVFIVSTAFSNGPPAWAAGPSICQDYVNKAIAAAQQVRDMRCGYDLSHPQWSTDPNVHARWCRTANEESVQEENGNRHGRLGNCSWCRSYAEKAIAAARTAAKNGCTGLDGPRWSPDEQVHFGWCIGLKDHTDIVGTPVEGGLDIGPARQEESERNAALGACLVQKARQPLVSEPARPARVVPRFEAKQPAALHRPPPHVSGPIDTVRKESAKKKRPKAPRLQVAKPCTLPNGRPCLAPTKVFSPSLVEGGGGPGAHGPSATGTPLQTSSPQVQRSGGGGVPGLR